MPAGTALSRAIDRLVSDLSRIAQRVVTEEVNRAFLQVSARNAKPGRKAKARTSLESRREAARLRKQAQEQRKLERATARKQRKDELERLKQERAALRMAARNARDQAKRERVEQREAERQAREEARKAALAPPPVVVFKRTRDGQVTVLKPRPVAAEGAPAPPAN
jgi:hypothetical protein